MIGSTLLLKLFRFSFKKTVYIFKDENFENKQTEYLHLILT
jgi:hypothetical protein